MVELPQMKLSPPLIFFLLFLACSPSLAAQDEAFVEIPFGRGETKIYDLRTVRVIQPGRFTIVSTWIDDADRMKLELKVLDTLRIYCKRPDGKYPAPNDLFVLGPPDMPIQDIEVKTRSFKDHQNKDHQDKEASWHYPYERFAWGPEAQDWHHLECTFDGRDRQLYRYKQKQITDGTRWQELFDCKRGLTGNLQLLSDEEFPAKSISLEPVVPQSNGELLYRTICLRVTHEEPYLPLSQ
jgi:hypothetical protein